jgi:hypothetical protein
MLCSDDALHLIVQIACYPKAWNAYATPMEQQQKMWASDSEGPTALNAFMQWNVGDSRAATQARTNALKR